MVYGNGWCVDASDEEMRRASRLMEILIEESWAYEAPSHMRAWYCERCDIRGTFYLCHGDNDPNVSHVEKLSLKHKCREERFNPSAKDHGIAG
jgi:hypothetical protein